MRARSRPFSILLALTLFACAPLNDEKQVASSSSSIREVQRLVVGELASPQLSDLLARANVDEPSGGPLEFRTIRFPVNVELKLGDGKIALDSAGGADFPIILGIRDGVLWSVELSPQSRLLTLDEAWEQVEGLCEELTELGFATGPSFSVGYAVRVAEQPNSLAEAKLLLLDDSGIAELGVYAGEASKTRVGLSMWSSRRKAEELGISAGPATDGEWRVILQIVRSA